MRQPAVAGQFYEGTKEGLLKQIEWCYKHQIGPRKLPEVREGPRSLLGLVSPHAGYMYSGPVAAHGFVELAADGRPDSFVILGPNHHGLGSGVSLRSVGRWRTPLGEVLIDTSLAKEILKNSDLIDDEEMAHLYEHSIEVQLPFLQHLYGEIKFVPISMMLQDLRTDLEVGRAVGEACRGKNVVVIASTDFTHYEPHSQAVRRDQMAIKRILELDARGLVETVEREGLSMCGYGPVAAMLEATSLMGARKAKLLKHATSGETSGMMGEVVGYASIGVYK